MKVVDLTHPISENTPVYPGDPMVQIKTSSEIGKDGYADHLVSFGTHVGTHMDAPAHMIPGGKKLGQFPIEKFVGSGTLIDVSKKKQIDNTSISNVKIREGDIVLFYTGWDSKYLDSQYFTEYPLLTESLARELVTKKVKIVGTDTCSPDKAPFSVHKILLGNEILIIENLTNLQKLTNKNFIVYALPLASNLDGAQTRAIAVYE